MPFAFRLHTAGRHAKPPGVAFHHRRDQRSQLRSAKNEGLAEGRADGLAEGLRETAKKMKADGLDLSVIQKYTGLSSAEVKNL